MAVGFLWVMLQLWWLLWFIWQQRRTKNMSPGSMPYVSLKVNIYNMGVSVHFIFFSAGNQVDFWPTKGNTTEPASYLIPITCNLILCCLHHYRKVKDQSAVSRYQSFSAAFLDLVLWECLHLWNSRHLHLLAEWLAVPTQIDQADPKANPTQQVHL